MATLFSHYKSMEIFSGTQGQPTRQSEVGSGQILNSLEFSCISLLPASMKGSDERQPRKIGDTVFTILTLFVAMKTIGLIWQNFELILALMYVIITCKYEKDPIKNNREKSGNTVFQIITLSVATETSSLIWPNYELIQAFMYVLIACRYEKDQMKNSGGNVKTSFSPLLVYGIFSNAQGQPTP